MRERSIIYARVSTDDQRDNFSISTQVAECHRYLQQQHYTLVGDQYIDPETGGDVACKENAIPAYVDDISSSLVIRPGLTAALSFATQQGVDVVVIHSLDRLARDPYNRKTIELEFEARNVRVEYALGNYENTPEGEVRKDLDATFAKWENAKRVERCNRGKRGKAQANQYVAGKPPYGYDLDKNAFGGLAIVPEQAQVVQWIFQAYVEQSLSIRKIVNALNEQGQPTYRGNSQWALSTVSRLLRTTHYAGHYYYNQRKREKNKLVYRDPAEWIEMACPPLVDEDLFEEAQRMLAFNKDKKRKQPKRFYLLSGMIFCEDCQKAYSCETANAGSNRRAVDAQHYRHRVSQGHCCNHQVSARVIDPIIWREIRALLLNPEYLLHGYQENLAQIEAERLKIQRQSTVIQDKINKLESTKNNLLLAYADPELLISKEEFLKQRLVIEAEMDELQKQVVALEQKDYNGPSEKELLSIQEYSAAIQARIIDEQWQPTQKNIRQVLELLHVIVYVNKEGSIRIEGWFGELENVMYTPSTCYGIQPPPPPAPV